MGGDLRRQIKVPGEVALTSGHPIMSGLNLILDEKRFRRSRTATGLPPPGFELDTMPSHKFVLVSISAKIELRT